MNRQLYLDTSGLNFLVDRIKDTDLVESAKAHLDMELYLSPVTLWEVLLNSMKSVEMSLFIGLSLTVAPNY
ncbi:hypothetical protein AB4169_08415 [Vibrio lentus]